MSAVALLDSPVEVDLAVEDVEALEAAEERAYRARRLAAGERPLLDLFGGEA